MLCFCSAPRHKQVSFPGDPGIPQTFHAEGITHAVVAMCGGPEMGTANHWSCNHAKYFVHCNDSQQPPSNNSNGLPCRTNDRAHDRGGQSAVI